MLAEHPMCARLGTEWWWTGPRKACSELATEDDHIIAIAHGGDEHDPTNRQGLCSGCHGVKTAAEARISPSEPATTHPRGPYTSRHHL